MLQTDNHSGSELKWAQPVLDMDIEFETEELTMI